MTERRTLEALIARDRFFTEAIETVQERLADLKQQQNELRRDTIPVALHELGLRDAALSDGTTVTLTSDVTVRVRDMEAAVAWLMEKGWADIVSLELVAALNVDDQQTITNLSKEFEKRNIHATPKLRIHPQTLRAWARERIRAGESLPDELFELDAFNWAKIKHGSTS